MKSMTPHGRDRSLSSFSRVLLAFFGATACLTAPADAEIARIKSNPDALILDGVRISGDMETFFLSGQLPSPIDPNKPMTEIKSIEDMGDTKTQTISALQKIKALLESQGYSMSDLVKLQLFIAADPRTGKMDFAGANEGFRQFFGTTENPGTVARSTFQVAALVGPYFLIEIEALAVKPKSSPSATLNEQPASEGEPARKAAEAYQRPHRYPKALRKKAFQA